ncbi:bifunctional chorismate-binding protein/class IV aminotransferase [Burkholderia sp. Ac-20353]|uniref:bifunctional chorismate-binding protein/class IV aminotransferase n=1 Tax=Burkholderia sp. Ac-20353 TaxID=2703894 RepID=UPI00197B3758|nr:bifunctional chorismate-binding protein/class IV aminotransferase [Burkholderia sp. Ac-20353]MBN3786553.1 hypothetical protein [Burkholderia sp. Ac-20353]
MNVFALLDDCTSKQDYKTSHLYTDYVHQHVCRDFHDFELALGAVAEELHQGLHALLISDYEFRQQVHGNATLRMLVFRDRARLSSDEVYDWLRRLDLGRETPSVAGIGGLSTDTSFEQYSRQFQHIRQSLINGDSYQVNLTYRLGFDMFGSPVGLYRRLRDRQPVPFGVFISLPDGRSILSFSPELFVERSGNVIRARPMKGTAARSTISPEDHANAEFLRADPKNRAENVMIVDLLGNDISQIAETGSVRVPALFTIEPHGTVWQMTSTIEANVCPDATFFDIFRAMFPCGSITGAPKLSTMDIICKVEASTRGSYTGSIGWIDKASSTGMEDFGDFCLSVAIRTLELSNPCKAGIRRGIFGVGGGIVLDSQVDAEYEETTLKARFLTELDPGLALTECMYATQRDGVRHLNAHIERIQESARWFNFPVDIDRLLDDIKAQCAQLSPDVAYELEIQIAKPGVAQFTTNPVNPTDNDIVGVVLAHEHGFQCSRSDDPLLRHKTTLPREYERARDEAKKLECYDMIFFNERYELTEGTHSNVFVLLDGNWYTPPTSCGLYNGVMREVVLNDPAFGATERIISRREFLRADAIFVSSTVHGPLKARALHRL